ncbi:two-component regulator propeller domain-containing protein [Chryseobacterium sp. JM1]|uniref:two-component regulator propeller domain-containing protein n=1 Tax=Chryseobacterium sp. JM1 TaxID=1233950 RepID=UPI0004E79526|nr:two-component regulator propeller domain-containing protein [Chryseobacterium sp. JM1]KFF21701.1 hypothetical protein IW22_07115 [Chryseobacterium sp. JM1]
MVNYNEEDGLNNSYTYSLSQDPTGLLWIGSDNGLFRFDGKEFKHFNNKQGLKNIEALSCIPLSNGEIFVAPFLNDFAYLKNGKVINSDMNSELKKIQLTHNPDYYIDGSSLYLYSPYNPNQIYFYRNGKINRIPVDLNIKSGDEYYSFGLNIPDHVFYLFNQHDGGKVMAYDIISKKKTVCNISARKSTFILRKGDIFVFRNKRNIDIYKLQHPFYFKKIKSYKAQHNVDRHIIDNNYRLWLCLEEGGILYFKESLLEDGELSHPVKMMEN